ncbi:MAG: hypothetical protein A2020_02150 [Lentisphaerae bacterium GWF2_45_14]|nr:MAG: hypothetical protein A2020_02150 [Lentisphaerae bacterium GWF2_45_14]
MNTKKLILVIDDEPALRRGLKAYFEDSGYIILEAENGIEGLAIFREKHPDLVLCDLMMPGMSGSDVIKTVSTETPDTPVIAISGTGIIEDSIKAIRNGAWDYIIKPVPSMVDLQYRIERSIERSEFLKSRKQYFQELEIAVKMRTAELELARDSAEAGSRAKSEFIANMSHEFKTPLNSIIGFSDLLGEKLSGNQKIMIDYVYDSGKKLLTMIDHILEYSRLESSDVSPDISNTNIPSEIASSIADARKNSDKGKIQFSSEIAEGLSHFPLDASMLRKIMANLLSNAVKFMPGGGTVTINASINNGGELVLKVSDVGIGISPEEMGILFQPFRQLSSFREKAFDGAGIGLVIAKRLVELHGGNLSVDSKSGKGSTFIVTIPPHCLA